jgi:hypothetical protein
MKRKTLSSLCFFQTKSQVQHLQKSQLLTAVHTLLIMLGMSSTCFGQVYQNTILPIQQVTRSGIIGSPSQTYTFIAGEDDTEITVECWGAGGGGSFAKNGGAAVAGGGGGAYARRTITVIPCAQYTVVVGGGGEGYQRAGDNGTDNQFQNNGKPSYFIRQGTTDTLVKAAGGKSGEPPRNYTLVLVGQRPIV